ncbi:hypothetical protein HQ394_15970 [Defluviicoccus vanus]|uniref:Uncharacterized protein n=1 Tax=Defluviicoccus vanus TaxID=111831 RepID=A0A7H1N4B3_9PROT|nr:hypothetical protein HQ394_15970 [Defluviicoccus vanus]
MHEAGLCRCAIRRHAPSSVEQPILGASEVGGDLSRVGFATAAGERCCD